MTETEAKASLHAVWVAGRLDLKHAAWIAVGYFVALGFANVDGYRMADEMHRSWYDEESDLPRIW